MNAGIERGLTVTGMSKAYGGRTVLAGVSLTVAPGEVVALVGPNGTGKTTLLRCLLGSERPDAGEATYDARPVRDTDPTIRAAVCTVLDDAGFFPDVSVIEHLDVLARGHGTSDPDRYVDSAMEVLGLTGVAEQLPWTLSSGQRRRLSLASALVRPWSLLILDEPEQRLDVAGRQWLGEFLNAVAAQGRSVLMASHDPELLELAQARIVELASHD